MYSETTVLLPCISGFAHRFYSCKANSLDLSILLPSISGFAHLIAVDTKGSDGDGSIELLPSISGFAHK